MQLKGDFLFCQHMLSSENDVLTGKATDIEVPSSATINDNTDSVRKTNCPVMDSLKSS